jgi:uncharacterized caspase-like protein
MVTESCVVGCTAEAQSMNARLGFEVLEAENAGRKAMLQRLRDYRDRLRPDSIGLFYYAGHAIQVKGQNYLIPIDAAVRSEAEVDEESVNLAYLLDPASTAAGETNGMFGSFVACGISV